EAPNETKARRPLFRACVQLTDRLGVDHLEVARRHFGCGLARRQTYEARIASTTVAAGEDALEAARAVRVGVAPRIAATARKTTALAAAVRANEAEAGT